MTQAQERSFDIFRTWWQRNERRQPCRFCAYIHDGPHDYQNHLQEEHPEKWAEFKKLTGLK